MTAGRGARGGTRTPREPGPVPDQGGARHIPVLLAQVLESLAPRSGGRYIDATFGAGGYTRAILAAADCRILAIERDPEAFEAGRALLATAAGRLILARNDFGRMEQEAAAAGFADVDGVVFDVGVSSMQLDDPARGFSFLHDGPLDMRMRREGPSAATLVNEAEEEELADILYNLGEERRSRAIARAIVRQREQAPITTTKALADIVERTLGRARGSDKHPATRTFQALRIHVNDELGELARGLAAAERLLRPDGRLVVVTFHSLEDRIVKRFLQARSGKEASGSRHLPPVDSFRKASFRILNPRPLTPDERELAANPRARSAKLRAAERLEAPPWPDEG